MNILFFLTPKSEVEFIYDDFTLRQAVEKMEHHHYTAVPILNRSGAYVGTITEGDILRIIKDKFSFSLHDAETYPIRQAPRRWKYDPVNINCNIEDLLLTAMRQNFVPVVDDDNKFIGIITRKDILDFCFRKLKETEGAPQ